MTPARALLLSVLSVLVLAAAPAGASTLTRVTVGGEPAYMADDADTADTMSVLVAGPTINGRDSARAVADDQTYTFATTDTWSTPVPTGCGLSVNAKTVTCEDTSTVDADVATVTLEGHSGNDTISARYTNTPTIKVILKGGQDDDLLIGGSLPEEIRGENGDHDTLSCNDSYHNRSGASGVTLGIGTAQAGCDSGEIVLTTENVIGTKYDDTLTGDQFANRIDGAGGSDKLFGGGGEDVLLGGAGADELHGTDGPARETISFDDGRMTPVALDLSKAPAIGGDAGDTYVGTFEGIEGTPFDDTLTGDVGSNIIRGLAGNDVIRGGSGGDKIDGGAGAADQLHFDGEGRTAGVTVDLSALAGDDGDLGEQDVGFEQLFGTDKDDNLTTTVGADTVFPGAGADTVSTLAGADDIHVDDGELDTVDCGDDADTVKRDIDDSVANCETVDPPVVVDPDPTAEPTEAPTEEPTAEPTDEPPSRARPRVTEKFKVKAKYTKVKTLTVTLPSGGGKVAVTCDAPKHHAAACAFTSKTVKRSSSGPAGLAGLFKHRKLPPGTEITLKVTGTHVRTTTFTFTIRKGKAPATG